MTLARFQFLTFLLLSSFLHAGTILIDFGDSGDTTSTSAPNYYNNVTNNLGVGTLVGNLRDTADEVTGISLSATNWFAGVNTSGTTHSSAPYLSSATGDTLYDANGTWSQRPGDAKVVLVFGGLDALKTYDFTMYASRTGTTENRSTLYSFTGATSDAISLNPASNITQSSTISGMSPNGSGTITLTITPDAANANQYDFIYLGAMEINVIPEPTTITLVLGALGLMMLFRRRR